MAEENVDPVEQSDDDPFKAYGGKIIKPTKTNDPFAAYGGKLVEKKSSGSAVKSTLPPSLVGGQNDPNFLGLTNNQQQYYSPINSVEARDTLESQNRQQVADKKTAFSNSLKKIRNQLPAESQQFWDKAVDLAANREPDRLSAPTQEEIAHQQFMDSTPGKILGKIAYLGSKATKGSLQIAKGVAHLAQMSQNPTMAITGTDNTKELFDKLDNAANFGLTKTDIANIEEGEGAGNHALAGLGMMSEFAPTIALGEATAAPKAMFYLQGLGQGKDLADNLTKQNKNLNPLAKEALIQGSGFVNMILSDLGDNLYGKLPSVARGKIATGIVTDALKENAGATLTYDTFKTLLNKGAKTFAEKFEKAPVEILNKYNHTAATLGGLNLANFGLHKGVDALNDKPVFNETAGDLAENVTKTLTQEAPLFTALGAVPDVTKLTPYSNYKNDVVESIVNNPSRENVDNLKQQIAEHGSEQGWSQEEMAGSLQHIEQIAQASTKIPNTIKPEKRGDAIGLIIDRDGLSKRLAEVQEAKKNLDPAIADIPSEQETYLTDKIEQANDKLRSIVTGKPVTYSKDTETDKTLKSQDGKQEEISPSRYEMERTERELKSEAPEAVQTAVDPSLANSEAADPALGAEEVPAPTGEIPAPTGELPADGSEIPTDGSQIPAEVPVSENVTPDPTIEEPVAENVPDPVIEEPVTRQKVSDAEVSTKFKNKEEVAAEFKKQTGHDIEMAGAKKAGIELRNNMRNAGNLDGEKEINPYTSEQEKLITQFEGYSKKSPYLFHTSSKENLENIAKKGLLTGQKPRFEGVSGKDNISLAANEETAKYYGKDDDIILRVKKSHTFDDLETDALSGEGSYITKKPIPASSLEIKTKKGWKPLETYYDKQKAKDLETPPPTEPLAEKSIAEPEDKTTTLRNADVEAKRAEYGFQEPAPRKGTTDAEFDAKADEQIKSGVDAHELMDKVLIDKKPITGVESVILSKYQGTKEAELLDVNDRIEKATDSSSTTFSQLVADRDRVLEDLQRAYDASEASGTVASDALRARKVRVAQDTSLAGFLVRERMQVNKGEKLSQEQIKAVSDEYKDIQQKNEAYQKKIAELQEQLKTVGAEKILKRVQEEVKLETRRNKRTVKVEQLDKDIEDTFAALKKIAREKRGTLSANPIPVEYLPELAKLVKLYTQKGATTLTGIVDELYHGLKDDIEGLTKDHVLEAISNLPEATKKDPLKAMKSRLKSSIRRVQEKTEAEDFTPTKKNKIVLDEEALKLRDELEKARYEYELRLHRDAYKNRTKKQRVLDAFTEVINTPRALLASTDFSAPLRQGLVPTIAHPVLAARAFTNMFKAAFSQNHFDRWFYDLKEAPDYAIIKESKLYVSDPHKPELAAKEEQFMNNLAEKIPFFGKLVRGSERAYVGYLNKLRVDLFRQTTELYESQGKTIANSPELYKGLGKFINNATGRGDFTNENLAQSLNLVLFSPRLIASRLNLLNPVWYSKLPKEVRYQAIGDMAKFIGVGVSLLALAKANGFQVEADPRSADFGKLRSGDKRWDIWGGFSQYVRLFAQELMGQTKSTSTGDITPLGGDKFGARTRLDVAASFMRNKLSPVPAFIANTLAGKDAMGQEFDPVAAIPKSLIPLTLQDTYQAVQKEGLKGMFSTGIPTTFGVGVQTYSDLKPAKEVEPKKTIEVANGSKYQLTEPQLAERKKYNDEWLAKHEDKQRAVYLKAANNDPELKMEIATKSAKYRSMGQDKAYIDAHRQSLIDNYVTKKLSAAANKYSKMQMLKKYRGQKGQYNLEKSEE